MKIVKFLNEIKEPKVSELGGKGYSLVVLTNDGFNVPKGFVITSEVFFEFLKSNNLVETIEKLTAEINEDNFQEKSGEIRNLILNGKIPEEIASGIREALEKLNVDYVSVRSSAVSEDSLKGSFAGLHDTFLNIKVEPNAVLENVKKCWTSLFNDRAVAYRVRKKISHLEGISVIIQEMIPAEIAGTCFTAHPDTGDKNVIVIEATWGLGESLVSGSVTPDMYILSKKNLQVIRKKLGRKKTLTVPFSGGINKTKVPEKKMNEFCLNEKNVKEIASICVRIEEKFKYPQDIEWCIKGNKLWILQSRAITSLEVEI